jgi:nitroimidazol reductase NimA-like FMN-containing flavoprotein (pyridoxamine 5'-phosphate oxidase superfamily)
MIGVMGSYAYPSSSLSEPQDCYLHGYVSSRIMRLASHPTESSPEGIPICIAATKVDGLVLSLTPNSHSYNYRSAILHGHASIVTDPQEKVFAMRLVTNSVVPTRYENSRNPPDSAEMASTNILRVTIVSGSGKIREGGPHDEKKDEGREDVTSSTWTGVVPVYETLGEPVASASNRVAELPGYIRDYAEETTGGNRAYAGEAASKP